MIYVTHDQVEAMTLGQRIVVLKDGIIQQIDTPMALYDRPANLFVAGFLGSPAMNVLRGTLQGDASGVTVVDGDWRAPLGQATIDPAWLQKPIAVGVRPEHLQPASADDAHAFTARIEGIEPVGNEIFVNLSSGQHALTMRVAPQALPAVGEQIRVAIHPQGLHSSARNRRAPVTGSAGRWSAASTVLGCRPAAGTTIQACGPTVRTHQVRSKKTPRRIAGRSRARILRRGRSALVVAHVAAGVDLARTADLIRTGRKASAAPMRRVRGRASLPRSSSQPSPAACAIAAPLAASGAVNAPAAARSSRTSTFTLRRNTKRCSCDAIASASPSASTSIRWSSANRSSWNTARVRPLALKQALHCQCSRGRAETSLLNWAWARQPHPGPAGSAAGGRAGADIRRKQGAGCQARERGLKLCVARPNMIGQTTPTPDDESEAPLVPAAPVPVEQEKAEEFGGRGGLDPVRYGDWEKNGRCIDF